jgi:hypothetical protein
MPYNQLPYLFMFRLFLKIQPINAALLLAETHRTDYYNIEHMFAFVVSRELIPTRERRMLGAN